MQEVIWDEYSCSLGLHDQLGDWHMQTNTAAVAITVVEDIKAITVEEAAKVITVVQTAVSFTVEETVVALTVVEASVTTTVVEVHVPITVEEAAVQITIEEADVAIKKFRDSFCNDCRISSCINKLVRDCFFNDSKWAGRAGW